MSYSLIVLTSVTAAKRVEKTAKDYSLYCSTLHTPKTLTKYGCSYSVKVKTENLKQVYSMAEKMGLKIYGVFKELNEGGRINYVRTDVN